MHQAKDIYVLGIHDGHTSGAVVLKNGVVVAGITEERLTNIKNKSGVPALSIQKVLDIAGITAQDVTLIAVASKFHMVVVPEVDNASVYFKLIATAAPYFHSKAFIRVAVELLRRVRPRTDLVEALRIIGIDQVPMVYVEHHMAHAATAYYRRPWKNKTLIFTLDGTGDGLSATVSIGAGDTITRIAETSYFDSPSDNVYSNITEYLGLKRFEHEYKVMGLAPYGNYKETIDVFRKIMRLNPTHPLEFENRTRYYHYQLQALYRKHLFKKRFDHIAAGVQKFFEELVCSWVGEAIKVTGVHSIALSGGSFLNVKTNMLLRTMPEVSDMFIYPACDDSGIAEGAAIVAYISYCRDHHLPHSIRPLTDVYYGQEFGEDAIVEFLKKKKLFRSAINVDAKHIATLLAGGAIIARCAGRDEWGPRALGNRSIMADPRDLRIVHRLNSAIKQRDFWMPFAPAMLAEDQPRYVKHNHFSPYMIEAFDTKEKSIDEIIATVHSADHTTRPMTVNEWNPQWQNIISEFKKITGVGALLNTSFNLHG
ncbi:hypothetical protein HY469_02435, partial [Candidatus Roizmanbacteria bacterium]|nr:hypothetical protein [Candidatus Roizmanbacteria bacterium]